MKDFLEILNPWWFEEKDNDLEKWEVQRIKWVPNWLKKISLKPFSLNFPIGLDKLEKPQN